jgi:hypothetical protein
MDESQCLPFVETVVLGDGLVEKQARNGPRQSVFCPINFIYNYNKGAVKLETLPTVQRIRLKTADPLPPKKESLDAGYQCFLNYSAVVDGSGKSVSQ